MKKTIMAALFAAVMAFGSTAAFAVNTGPGGSSEHDGEQYTNDVTCGTEETGSTDVGGLFSIGQSGSPEAAAGGAELCSDGDDAVGALLQGRIGVTGSAQDASGTFYADGDKDNAGAEQAQGWAAATIGADGVSVVCGATFEDGGNLDSQNPTEADTMDECG